MTKSGVAKLCVPRLDHMVELASVELARKQVEELAEIVGIEALEGRELPEHRPELFAELAQARPDEAWTKPPVSANAF